jgi:hypothetical protein
MKVLLQSLSDGPSELAPVLAMAFLTIIDSPRTRAYLHPGTDLEMGLSGITDAYGRGETHMEHMKASARVVITMLRSWSGEHNFNVLSLISRTPRFGVFMYGRYASYSYACRHTESAIAGTSG